MAAQTITEITREVLENYLPHPLRYKPERGEESYRTAFEASRSRSHVSINMVKGTYFDFHTNTGSSIVSLLRQYGAPIPGDMAANQSWHQYKFQLAILGKLRSEGSKYRCGQRTAMLTELTTGEPRMIARVMCLRWDCPRCSVFLRRVWMERLANCHFGAIYTIPTGYEEVGKVLAKIQTRAKRAGGCFHRVLLKANDMQILLVDGRSHPMVTEWLDHESFFERIEFMPSWEARTRWLGKGLEHMDRPMHWSNKVRCSRGLVDNVITTQIENKTSSTSTSNEGVTTSGEEVQARHREPKYEWVIVHGRLDVVAVYLERRGYVLQWLGEHVVKVLPRGT